MTPPPALMIRLSGLLFWFDESLQASLAAAGFQPVTRTQSLFLLCLAAGENRPSRLAAQLGVSRQVVSHIITELTRRGLITLAVDPTDARGRIDTYSFDAQDLHRAARKALPAKHLALTARSPLAQLTPCPAGSFSFATASPRPTPTGASKARATRP